MKTCNYQNQAECEHYEQKYASSPKRFYYRDGFLGEGEGICDGEYREKKRED